LRRPFLLHLVKDKVNDGQFMIRPVGSGIGGYSVEARPTWRTDGCEVHLNDA